MPAKPEPQQNHLLAALSPQVQGCLFPYLEMVPLPFRSVMYESGHSMRHIYFPTDSIISFQYVMENGASTAILVVGNEGLTGITLFMGGESTPSRSLVLMLRYTQALITQIAQTALKLQKPGVISCKRGLITVLDRPGLEAACCDCYEVVRKETDLLLAYLPQRQVGRNSDSIRMVTLPTSDTAKIPVPDRQVHVS